MRSRIITAMLLIVLAIAFFLPTPVEAQTDKRSVKSHALAKVAVSAGKAALAVPKAAAVGIKDTIGGVLFSAEAVVDVIHVGTSALNAAASKELKHNPFEYIDEYVGKADNGLETAYLFFFQVKI